MNFEKLVRNITDNIREAQIKLGFDSRPISLNYTENSLKNLLRTDDIKSVLEKFSEAVRDKFGDVTFREIKDGYCLTVSATGTEYINGLEGYGFLTEFIETIRRHGVTVDEVFSVFRKYSDNVVIEEKNNDEFNYLVYFADGKPDGYMYCLATEQEIDGHEHVTYHRFTTEDYEELGF
ncbi:MAG: DUF3877 family protein [Ruminococcus sp.]|nr:DUF3877 family protein [Ruminococcus sp.]